MHRVLHRVLRTNLGTIQASNLGRDGEGGGGGCTCNSVTENGSQPGLCYYQFLPGYTEAVKSVPKPSKALETVPCMEALTILPRSNA